MADPRAAVRYAGIDYRALTIAHDATIVYSATESNGSAQVGLAVSLESDGVVTLAGDGENVFGKLISVDDDGFCTVQYGGIMDLPGGDGATLTAGSKVVGDLNATAEEGYIREVATATAAELGVARGIVIDSSTAAETVVYLP